MKATMQSIILAVLMSATGIANSQDALYDEYGNQLMSIAYASCTIGVRDGKQFSEVSAVDRSNDLLPAPREGATCAEYTEELIKFGARVDQSSDACWDLDSPYLPGSRQHKLCIFVIVATYYPWW
jgi:hypothetical protein